MNNENEVLWKAYEEIRFSDHYVLRWIRKDDEYINTITKEMMEDLKNVVQQQQDEINALQAKLNYMFQQEIKSAKTVIKKEIT